MVLKLNVWVFVTVLCIFAANGYSLSAFDSSEELDTLDSDLSLAIDDSDYWDLLSELSSQFYEKDVHERAESTEDEKWNQLDNLEFTGDDDIAEMIPFSVVNRIGYYRFGKRVRGDKIVAFNAKNQSWPRAQNITTNMTYPAAGYVGRKLTYIEIQVNQSSDLGKAYIARGGINNRFITILVEAYHIFYFNFKATFFGL